MAKLDGSFWDPHETRPVPLLGELRDWCLRVNPKRLPKWRFRLGDDLAVQIQPRPGRRDPADGGRTERAYEGLALGGPGVTLESFKTLGRARAEGLDVLKLRVNEVEHLHDPTGEDRCSWEVRAVRVWCRDPEAGRDYFAWRDRVFAALVPENFADLTAEMMLSASCLRCAKHLEDPASVARWIGPVCWGSSELPVPRLVRLAALSALERALRKAAREGDEVAAMALSDFYEENGEPEKAAEWRAGPVLV